MPMDFPDMKSLKFAAKVHKFREPRIEESDEGYREALADHVANIDLVESQEIRHKVGWDKFDEIQKVDLMFRGVFGSRERVKR